MFRRFCGLQFHCLILATRPWRIIQCIITLFTVSFSHLHNNVIQRGCDALMLKLQNSPKLPRLHTGFYYYAKMSKLTMKSAIAMFLVCKY